VSLALAPLRDTDTRVRNLLTSPQISALGLPSFYCFALFSPLISPSHQWAYHVSGSTHSVYLATLCNVALVWLLLFGLLAACERFAALKIVVWSGILCATPWFLMVVCRMLAIWLAPDWLRVSLAVLASAGWIGLAVALLSRRSLRPQFHRVQNGMAVLLGCVACSTVISAGHLAWCTWQTRALNLPRPLHRRQAVGRNAAQPASFHPGGKPRIIWLILDELSYRQVYERRFPGLELPAFDRMASQSTNFTHVIPAGIATEKAVPTLLTGFVIDDLRLSGEGDLVSVHQREPGAAPPASAFDGIFGRGHWRPFDPRDTVFEDALNAGYHTAIAGWYNPYCRILPEVLDRCFWTYRGDNDFGMHTSLPALVNTAAPWRFVLKRTLQHLPDIGQGKGPDIAPLSDGGGVAAALHIADYRQLLAAGDQLLNDSSSNFLLLHMPVPHPSGIYDRATGDFATHGASYVDNLALADKYLAHMRSVLEQRGEWNSSVIVVMGDHSWRTELLWRHSPRWTGEDEAASQGGRFDDRPAYLIKLPFQQLPARFDTPYAAVHTRMVLQQLLRGEIATPAELAALCVTAEKH
jgi:hypothetical protein